MDLIDLMIGVITAPAQTFKKISDREPVFWALLINLFLFSLSFFQTLAIQPSIYQGLIGNILGWIFFVGAGIIFLLLFTGLLFLISKLLKGSGRYWQLFCVLSFSNVIMIFSPINSVISHFLDTANPLTILLGLGLSAWAIILVIIAIREAQQFTTV